MVVVVVVVVSGFVGEVPFILAKPQTYMNLSGESVSDWDIYYYMKLGFSLCFEFYIVLIADWTACGLL